MAAHNPSKVLRPTERHTSPNERDGSVLLNAGESSEPQHPLHPCQCGLASDHRARAGIFADPSICWIGTFAARADGHRGTASVILM